MLTYKLQDLCIETIIKIILFQLCNWSTFVNFRFIASSATLTESEKKKQTDSANYSKLPFVSGIINNRKPLLTMAKESKDNKEGHDNEAFVQDASSSAGQFHDRIEDTSKVGNIQEQVTTPIEVFYI